MIWLIITVVVLVVGWLVWSRSDQTPDAGTYQTRVALYLIRRRLDLSQFKVETKQDGAHLRRELRDELNALEKRERKL